MRRYVRRWNRYAKRTGQGRILLHYFPTQAPWLNPSEAVICNIKGTKVLADISVKYLVKKFVMISTDKAVNPTSVMGASKRIAEIYVQSLNNFIKGNNPESTSFITTRFGNVLGSNGSVIP